ncbi:hypothetical protein RIR_e58006_A0A2N1MP79_9GLOM [Rhizophagus irregularis DAOM 181602=DAOM 197198]|uniref:Uncharacterized protein n=2 Tax=Rhizophagus irregularis TaxID=588596 RepID=A0A2N1MP79_9GLOM|nr:hypothetical protein RhiirC2_788883 [Rhizophagus irregularis]GBC44107.1 hypothetical protein RIR_e58006_A0A2N1MP79_9GLOM [Rhizophagus irregularis DAOM 181602=DAOM 197198]CAG8582216.1 14950_t:CDS:2 [Rhizophagus irregularis]
MNHSNISRDFSNQTFYSTNDYEESTFMDDASTQSFPMPNSLSYLIKTEHEQSIRKPNI